jgi:chorismate dehydratase
MTSAFIANNVSGAAHQATSKETRVASRTRLGQFSFINSLPIVLPLMRGEVALEADVTLAPPSKLNGMIADGGLDVSAVSSFEYLSRNDLAFIPDVSISCRGPVGSVLLFSKHSLEQLANPERTLVASAQSATSINLLRVMMLENYGATPKISADMSPELDSDSVDGVLVIGDHALEVDTAWSLRYLRIDMGDWWVRTTGLPMVFGLWAARMDWIERAPKEYATTSDALRRSKQLGLSRCFEAVLDEAEQRTGLARTRLKAYYESQIDFDLTPNHLEGLAHYKALLKKHGLI